jgi:hypothetical protein
MDAWLTINWLSVLAQYARMRLSYADEFHQLVAVGGHDAFI